MIGFDEVFLYKRSSLLYAACKPIYNIERDINIPRYFKKLYVGMLSVVNYLYAEYVLY